MGPVACEPYRVSFGKVCGLPASCPSRLAPFCGIWKRFSSRLGRYPNWREWPVITWTISCGRYFRHFPLLCSCLPSWLWEGPGRLPSSYGLGYSRAFGQTTCRLFVRESASQFHKFMAYRPVDDIQLIYGFTIR